MSAKRFFLSWIVSSIIMFSLSYAWHGYILNDFSRLNYPKGLFLILASFAYVVIGFIVVKVVDAKFYDHWFSSKIIKGIIKGGFCGVVFFLIAMVVGISLNTGTGIKNLILDVAWQAIEQGIGGGVVGIIYVLTENSIFWES